MSSVLTVSAAVPAASVPVSAPPLPLSAAAAGRRAAVVAVLFVPFRCGDKEIVNPYDGFMFDFNHTIAPPL